MLGDPTNDRRSRSRPAAWVRFVTGCLLLTGAVLVLMQGYAPPGPAGEVLRNNLRKGIDATPLFYTESDVSYDAEASIRHAMRESPDRSNHGAETTPDDIDTPSP